MCHIIKLEREGLGARGSGLEAQALLGIQLPENEEHGSRKEWAGQSSEAVQIPKLVEGKEEGWRF